MEYRSQVGAAGVSTAERLLLAFAAGCATAVLGYASVRYAEVALFVEANPKAVLGATQSPFVWRCGVAIYLGGAGGLGGHALAARSPAASGQWIARAAIAAAIMIAVQGTLLP